MPTAVRSHAKINLGLDIGAPRPDGFHSLATVYQTLELYDLVTVIARPAATTSLRLTSNDSRVPTDGATPHGRWLRWRWRRWVSPPRSRFTLKSGCRCRAGWGRVRPMPWRRWWGWRAELGIRESEVSGLGLEVSEARRNQSRLAAQRLEIARQGRLRCAAISDWRSGSGTGSRPGGLSPAGH